MIEEKEYNLNNCTQWSPGFCAYQQSVVSGLFGTFGILSCLSSIFIMLTIILLGGLNQRKLRFVIYLNISDFLAGLGAGITIIWVKYPASQSFGCQLMVWMSVMGNSSSCIWSAIVATFVAFTIFYKVPGFYFELLSQLTWIGCILMASMGYIMNYHDYYIPSPDGTWCWIGYTHSDQIMYFEYMWVFGSMIYLFLVYPYIAYIFWKVKREVRGVVVRSTMSKHEKIILKMAGYPFIFLIAWLPMAICRVISMLGGQVNIYVLDFSVLWHALNGVFNAIWYAYSRNIVSKLNEKYHIYAYSLSDRTPLTKHLNMNS